MNQHHSSWISISLSFEYVTHLKKSYSVLYNLILCNLNIKKIVPNTQ